MDDNVPKNSDDNHQPPVENQSPSPQVPQPPEEEGYVDERAATDTRPLPPNEQSGGPTIQPEPGRPIPTLSQLDKSHESDLDEPDSEPTVDEKPVGPKASTPKKGNSAVLAVVIALLVTLLLVGIGYAAWQASKSSETGGLDTQDSNQPTDEGIDTSDADQIDQDLQQIESDLDQLDGDLDDASLEDENIGL